MNSPRAEDSTDSVAATLQGPDSGVLWVRIQQGPVNALTASVRRQLTDAAALAHDREVRAVVLIGNDRCFSAGGDIDELASLRGPEQARHVHDEYLDLYRSWHDIPVPTLAAIHGYALGGALELALACDLRYSDPDAFVAASGIRMGLVESAHSLPTVIADTRAAEMLFTGRRVRAAEAVASGLLTGVLDDLESGVGAIADGIARHSASVLRSIKVTLNVARSSGRGPATGISVGLWRELQQHTAHQHAAAEFLRKRSR